MKFCLLCYLVELFLCVRFEQAQRWWIVVIAERKQLLHVFLRNLNQSASQEWNGHQCTLLCKPVKKS